MKKVVKRKIKGFTLAELLAVIAILSVVLTFGITTTYMLIDRAKQSKINSDKNTISVAAQSYAQNNKSIMPKQIGDSIHIKISDLRGSNYLTEDIESSSGESCMENSYVRVYKLSST